MHSLVGLPVSLVKATNFFRGQSPQAAHQPITIVPTLHLGPDTSALRVALALPRHMVSFLISTPNHNEQEILQNTHLIFNILSLSNSNPLIRHAFLDMPSPSNIPAISHAQTSIYNSILRHPAYCSDMSFTGFMESTTMRQTLWSLPQLTFSTELVAIPQSIGGGWTPKAPPTSNAFHIWDGDKHLTTFLNDTFGTATRTSNGPQRYGVHEVLVQPNFPTFFRVVYRPQPDVSRRMNDLRTVRLSGRVVTAHDIANPPAQNYMLIGIVQLRTEGFPVDNIRLYDGEGRSWDPSDVPDLRECVLYYGKLPSCYFGFGDGVGDEDGGSCNIPLWSAENDVSGGDVGTLGGDA